MNAESRLFAFEQGIPGFEHLTKFVLEDIGDELPVKMLKAVSEPEVALIVASPFLFYPEYEWELADSIKQELDIQKDDEVEVWTVMNVPTDPSHSTINLLAPIVLNNRASLGKQIILHDYSYSSRSPINRTQGGS